MAKIVEEKVVVMLSRLVKNDDNGPQESFLSEEQLDTLQQAVEGLVDDPTVVVEVVV